MLRHGRRDFGLLLTGSGFLHESGFLTLGTHLGFYFDPGWLFGAGPWAPPSSFFWAGTSQGPFSCCFRLQPTPKATKKEEQHAHVAQEDCHLQVKELLMQIRTGFLGLRRPPEAKTRRFCENWIWAWLRADLEIWMVGWGSYHQASFCLRAALVCFRISGYRYAGLLKQGCCQPFRQRTGRTWGKHGFLGLDSWANAPPS